MILTTRNLTSQMQRLVNFIVLEGENKEFYWYAPYTNDICAHWRFVDESTARKSADKIYQMFCQFKTERDFVGMDMARKFLEMGFTRARRYANHSSGRKYDKMSGKIRPKSTIGEQIQKQKVLLFLRKCEIKPYDPEYKQMRKEWRASE